MSKNGSGVMRRFCSTIRNEGRYTRGVMTDIVWVYVRERENHKCVFGWVWIECVFERERERE